MHGGQTPAVEAAAVPSDGILLDVREDDEWAAGHAEGALHIPMGEVVDRFGEVTEQAADGQRVHVVCRAGGRSSRVAQYLAAQGVDVANVDGGMLAWEAAGRPMVSDGPEAAFVR